MSDNKNTGRGFGKGYYIALILCAAAIGITGYVYNRNAGDEPQLSEGSASEAAVSENQQANIPVIATQPAASAAVPAPTADTVPTEGKTALKTVSPVSGETRAAYSMEALSYNETTRDWRVHNGLDIAAEAGTHVVAAADGQVYTVYEDETLGHTVVITHAGGYTTRYSSLSEDIAVKAGDTVTAGQVIGTVGDTALVETAMGPHVHFSVSYRDEPMDPKEFLAMGV